ncbi:hypothetical protein AB0E62_00470 [Streptomyces sp. NPDC038707]|uniref:hypothetical protein n=1 Tax=Streptomyces sp. NPDC038707 TaxID=3154329 RepID=UPI0033CA7AE5
MVDSVKTEPAQVIHEVGRNLRKKVTQETYLRTLAYAQRVGLPTSGWRGEDREGQPLAVVWVTCGEHNIGHLLAVYEIQGRA